MRRLLVIMLVSLAAFGGVAFATHAIRVAATQAQFTLSITPARQSAARGGTAVFSVSVRRATTSTGTTALHLAGLPRGVSARWRLADGTTSGEVPPGETGATLTLRTSARARLGTQRIKVLATAGGATRARALWLIVQQPRLRRFSLAISRAHRIVSQGATATYKVRVARAPGFNGRVTLRVLKLTPGASATWTSTSLGVATTAGQRLGSDRIVVKGTSWVGGRAIRRYAVVVLTVVRAHRFPIGGDLATLLYPGGRVPLDLVLTNTHNFTLRVMSLEVVARDATGQPGCSGDANYAVKEFSGRYPLALKPGTRRRLSAFVADSSRWPQVSMRNLPTNQDACRGAVVSLDYDGLANR